MIDLDRLAAGGRSPMTMRWASNPLRRLFWLLGRPFISRLAAACNTELAARDLARRQAADRTLAAAAELTEAARQMREAIEQAKSILNSTAAPQSAVPLFVPPGHFYSPIVDPEALHAANFVMRTELEDVHAVRCDMAEMRRTFERLSVHFGAIDFPIEPSPTHRYYYENGYFSYADAIMLAAMIREFRPQRIIEVGSGFSSAVMLDTLDRMPGAGATSCTFIDPNPERLHSILRPSDQYRVQIIPRPVQSVPLELFAKLQPGDLLFLDTTHIVKTGSDVVHELFEILPRLPGGVLIHFHDIFAGFEYGAEWIFDENRSLNENYILRAFLMHNNAYEIVFFNDPFYQQFRDLLAEKCPLFLRNAGGSFWLKKL